MSTVEVNADGYIVDASLLADAFSLHTSEVKAQMRNGRITSFSERGEGEDKGRWRLTFHFGARALRLTISEDGTILSKRFSPCNPAIRKTASESPDHAKMRHRDAVEGTMT
jgi:hypothetical protein